MALSSLCGQVFAAPTIADHAAPTLSERPASAAGMLLLAGARTIDDHGG
jgi:hypothetical protein